MRYGLLAVVLIGAATLGGCTEGVLDPKGPIALAERQILLNALGIMLAIVIPVILATLGVAFWFRASNERARYRPNFAYSGRLEMLVWSIPAMTVLLVGGVAWVGAHDLESAQADQLNGQACQRSGRLARLEMAVHLSRAGDRERQQAGRTGRHADQLRADLIERDEQLLRASAREPDLHHVRNGDAPPPAGGPSGSYAGMSAMFSGDGFSDMHFTVDAVAPTTNLRNGFAQRAKRGAALDKQAYADLVKPSKAVAPFTYRAVAPDLFSSIVNSDMQPTTPICRIYSTSQRAER